MNAQKIPRLCGLKIRAITPAALGTTAIARGGENNLPDILLLLEHPPLIPSVLAEMLSLLNLILTNFQHNSERSLVAFFNIGKLILS
jgi:hypothetical protein